jgi:enoyl-CoA hydratase/carnithine racemase
VTGAGRAFCAARISMRSSRPTSKRESNQPETTETTNAGNWVTFLQGLAKPTIAAVNGAAVGIGVTDPADGHPHRQRAGPLRHVFREWASS